MSKKVNINVNDLFHGSHLWLKTNTIFLSLCGSHSYGTNNENSDIDIRGVVVPPKEYFLGFNKNFEQFQQNSPNDIVVYNLKKFMSLAADNNPNIIELLFTDEDCHIFINDSGKTLLENRNLFISKKCRYTFGGYAISQLKKIQRHYKWMKNPPKSPPTREEFGLTGRSEIPKNQLEAAFADVRKKVDSWQLDFLEEYPFDQRIAIQNKVSDYLSEIKVSMDDNLWIGAARTLGYSDNFIELLDKERRFKVAQDTWKQYQHWIETRNPKRHALEDKFGYDCYTDDTEFLTSNGFKKFDDIRDEDLLATVYIGENNTVRKHLGVEYQKPTEKFDGTFNGNIYRFFGNHYETTVTPNHQMLFREYSRKNKKITSDLKLNSASNLNDSFQFPVTITPIKTVHSDSEYFDKNIKISPENFLRLMGWYLADGCATFKNKKNKSIRISQKNNGKLAWFMKRFYTENKNLISCSLYEYDRNPTKFRNFKIKELILEIREQTIVDKIIKECNIKTKKQIPRWIFHISKRKKEILLDSLMRGDGTVKHHKTKSDSLIYYSKYKNLANDVQELAFHCGFETNLLGPYKQKNNFYEIDMYQVHVRKNVKQFKNFIQEHNLEKIAVTNQRVVCFSVPNSTLITRKNGYIAIHGNCKNAYHLVRLMRMAKEIGETGEVIVKRPDKDELLSIRDGFWTYEELIEWSEKQEQEIDKAFSNNKTLSYSPDIEKLNNLCIKLIENYL